MTNPAETVPSAAEAHIAVPEVKMHLYRPTEPCIGRVTKSEVCTAGGKKASSFVRHIEIDVAGTLLEGQVYPGQSIGVIPPGTNAKGKPHSVRLYSVASPTAGEDGQRKIISTTVKRSIDEHWEDHSLFLGVASNHLCDLKEGDEVRLSGPNGKRFLLPTAQDDHDYLFFATGTGIAPFRGFILDLLHNRASDKSRIALVMGVPYKTDLLYHDLFTELAQKHANFTYHTALSRQAQDDGKPAMYVQDRVTADRERLVPLLQSPRTLIYVCGVAGMELGIFQQIARLLSPDECAQYLTIDPAVAGAVDSWDKKMILRQVKPTKRVFLEVYA